MVYRKICGDPFIIPFSSIAPRWFGQSRLSQQELTEVATPFMAKIYKAHSQAGGGSLSEAEKYRRARQAFGRISGELARFGDHGQNDDRDHDGDNAEGGTGEGGSWTCNSSCSNEYNPSSSIENQAKRKGQTGWGPHLNRAAMKAKAALALIEYNNGMKLRALLRDNDVCDLVSTLWMIMPGVREVGSFLTTFPVKQKGGERPIQWRVDGDYVPDRVQFRLPELAVDTVLDKLKGGLAHDEEIELDSDGDRAGESEVYVFQLRRWVAQKKKVTEGLLPATTLDKIGEGVVSHPFVLLPVNFGGTHWECLVVDRGAKLVKMYDSMGGKRNRSGCRRWRRRFVLGLCMTTLTMIWK
ncbi:Ulp1 protease family, C-terminal catalytic domain [Phytophthora cactorum]|nr:Ulp1 protease family, C-terminal catalytic domain [Phytophthora cactorum]